MICSWPLWESSSAPTWPTTKSPPKLARRRSTLPSFTGSPLLALGITLTGSRASSRASAARIASEIATTAAAEPVHPPVERRAPRALLHAPGDDVGRAPEEPVQPGRLHAAALVAVHQPRAAQREEGARHAGARLRDLEAGNVPAAGRERLAAPGHEALGPAESGQAADEEFRLSFAAAKAARQVEVRQRAVHRARVNA